MSTSALLERIVSWTIPISANDQTQFQGKVRDEGLCLAGSGLHIFWTSSISELKNSEVEFDDDDDDDVDVVAWSVDHSWLLAAGTRSGKIIFVNSTSKSVLFSQVLVDNADPNRPVFTDLHFSHGRQLLVLMRDGCLMVLKCNAVSAEFKSELKIEDDDFVKEFQNSITVSHLDLSAMHDGLASSVVPLNSDCGGAYIISTGHGGQMLCMWQEIDNKYEQCDSVGLWSGDFKVVRCEVTSCGKYLVILTDAEHVKDFCVYRRHRCDLASERAGKSFGGEVDGLCLLVEGTLGKVFLKLVRLPSFHESYSVEVSPSTQLVHGDVSEDTLYYLDLDITSSSLQVVHLVQSLPEDKLAWLLTQHKFAEAEEFAIEHHIDLELVYKSRAKMLDQQLSGYLTSDDKASQVMTTLTQCMEKINDEQFIVNLVFLFSYTSLELTVRLLQFISSKLSKQALVAKANSALNWLTTYKLIVGDKNFNPELWRSFLDTSCLDLLKNFLCVGDFQSVFLLHDRHTAALLQEFDTSDFHSVLVCVPEFVKSQLLEQWLSLHLLPLVLQYFPQMLGEILTWTIEKIKLLELGEKDDWPGNGLRVSGAVLHSLASFKALASLQPHPLNLEVQATDLPPGLSDFKSLHECLEDLAFLLSNIQWLDISLSEYQTEPRQVVVFRILDRLVAAELVADMMKSKIIPYVQRHALNLDTVLLSYIKLFLSRLPPSWSAGPHEAKAIALIQAIKDVETHIEACVELLRHVQVSWSEEVEELIRGCLDVGHPACSSLKKQCRLVQLKRLLQGYEIRCFNFADVTRGWLYIRRIVSSNSETALKDALEVADMYQLEESEVYKHHLVSLVQKEKVEEATEVLESVSLELCLKTAKASLALASCKLNLPFYADLDIASERLADILLALVSLRAIRKCSEQEESSDCCSRGFLSEEWPDISAALDLYKRLLTLQMDYGLYLSPEKLACQKICSELFEQKVREFVEQSTESKPTTTIHKLTRFCSLLGIQEKDVLSSVGLAYSQRRQFASVKEFCWSLIDGSVDLTLLLSFILDFWEHVQVSPETLNKDDINFIKFLSSHAVSFCSGSHLPDAVEFYHLSVFFSVHYSVCMQIEGLEAIGNSLPMSCQSWGRELQYFQEDGMVLDQDSLLLALSRYVLLRAPPRPPLQHRLYPNRHKWLSESSSQVKDVASDVSGDYSDLLTTLSTELSNLLQENNHTQLPLHCTISTLTKLSQLEMTRELLKMSASPSVKMSALPLVRLAPGQSVLASLLKHLTAKVVTSKCMDHDYALCLLLALPPSEANEHLQALKAHRNITSYSRATAMCRLSLDYCHIMDGQSGLRAESQAILKMAEWGQRLSQYKVSFTRAFRGGGGSEEMRKVGGILLRTREADVEIVLQYCCEELGQESQAVLLTYLKVVLTEWEEPYNERAELLMGRVSNKKNILELFSQLLISKTHPYDYKKISFLLQCLQKTNEAPPSSQVSQGLLLLDCLGYYKRVSSPSEFEKQWYHDHYVVHASVSDSLPVKASTLLPFHPLLYSDNPMQIIGPELCRATVTKLTTISRLLELSMDDYYSTAIKNITLSCNSSSHPELQQESLDFDDLAPLLNGIEDMSHALLVARWLADHLQGDLNKSRALQVALAMARSSMEQATSQPELASADEAVKLLDIMLAISQTEKLLRHHHLDMPKYLEMTEATLIMELYTDAPELTQAGKMPPLHDIATELAQIYKVSLKKIQNKLIEQWLLSLGHSSCLDTTLSQVSVMDESISSTQDFLGPEDEDSLTMKRLVYLLSDADKLEANVVMLLNWAKRTSPVSCLSRVRTFQVLFSIASTSTIETISGKDISVIKDFMQSALFVCELESLQISTSLAAFIKCNKASLTRTLWRHHAQTPKAIRLVSELFLYYGVGDAELWKMTLYQLLHLAMFPYLRQLLKKLTTKPEVDIPSLSDVWQKSIIQPLEAKSIPLTTFHKEECDEYLMMVYCCPFPWKLDVAQLVEVYFRLGLKSHALACLALLPFQKDRDKLTQFVMSKLKKEDYSEILGTKLFVGNQQVREQVFSYLERQDCHEILLGSEYFNELVSFLVSRKEINKLLRKSLQLGRSGEAVMLVELYNKRHSLETTCTGEEAVMEYLSNHGNCFPNTLGP